MRRCGIGIHQTRPQAQTITIMSDGGVAAIPPRRSQRGKKQVERFGSGTNPLSRPSCDGISAFWIHQTTRRSESEPMSPIVTPLNLRLIRTIRTRKARKRKRSPGKPNRNARRHPPSQKQPNRRALHRRSRGYLRPHLLRRPGPRPPSERVNQRVGTPENRSMPRSWRRTRILVETTHSSVCGSPC